MLHSFMLYMHFPLHNSCRKCPTSISQARTLVHSKVFPPHSLPLSLPFSLCLLFVLHLEMKSAKQKHIWKLFVEWKTENRKPKPAKRQQKTTVAGRHSGQRQTPKTKTQPPFLAAFSPRCCFICALSMVGKCRENFTFESSFNGHYNRRERKRRERGDSHSSLRPF